ncbi:cold-shock protein [Erythrobacter sp. SD-21]|uniref:cold-shock protein n=1 Tax=Erythrobacter sp. SD-21 TaxID=161528 RepID=UPI000153FDED|nr:cold-shock protein [Erythrobacter sp. SD-21]EDL50057.1 hypothetical protein ED21_26338 [Erythrobacter sp. SD-21]
MTHFGTIKRYDSSTGNGSIAPEKGGNVLDFGKADLQQEASEPESGQRFSYETKQADGGKQRAVNLQQQEQGHSEKQGSQAKQQQG